ncbi:MAG: cytochrome c peroxidase [Verrucomicrobiales bacterium]|nr:cytochrome c peroxidase [Verrucomicrobiales bacterium]
MIYHTAIFAFLTSVATAAPLTVQLHHTHNGSPLLLDSLRFNTTAGETYSVSRLSYLLSEFALEKPDGAKVPIDAFAFIDAAKHRTIFQLREIPDGTYTALHFTVGLTPAPNKSNPASHPAGHPLNPALNNLHWTWQTGYIFLALEGRYRKPDNSLAGYVYHLANNPNETTVSLPASLDLNNPASLVLSFDIASLLNTPTPLSFANTGDSTHSHPGDPIATALTTNLPSAFAVSAVATSSSTPPAPPKPPLYLPSSYTPYPLRLSRRLPRPDLPTDNPLTVERVELGRRLFHEPLLSRNNTLSCASCHLATNAFSDPRTVSIGIDAQPGTRNSMPLFNLAWKSSFFWDGRAASLREQVLVPIEDHTELDESLENVVAKLSAHQDYPNLFSKAFEPPEITAEKIGLAVETFLLTILSYDSRFDRASRGEETLTEQEQRGFKLFMTEHEPRSGSFGADCFHCHGGPLFSDHSFHNNGLTPTIDLGLGAVSNNPADNHKFSTPSLRNVALTAPYMHDGRFATLEDVLDHYTGPAHRSPTLDPNLAKHPPTGLALSPADKSALVAFLKTLTDPELSPETPDR